MKHSQNFLFYISLNYSFEILRPLQQEIINQGNKVAWFVAGKEVNMSNFSTNELVLENIEDVIKFNPVASFVPGNVIPKFIPGIKVQVFHGLEWKKKGHFVIRDCFDLYCTHGKATTTRFNELAQKHQFFDVKETGWPKLDNLFNTPKEQYFNDNKSTILFAPTFSPSLTSAPYLYEQITALVNEKKYNWLVKFHPKMDEKWITLYSQLISDNFKIVESSNINCLLQSADCMLSDTSSVIGEFSLLGKPVISLNNSQPGNYLINITEADELPKALIVALSPPKTLIAAINDYADELHPYNDGKSSFRILEAVENILSNGKQSLKPLPLNIIRNLKQRKKLNYWKL
ncbi:MAG: CDP-glycerol glycerophosphotransferase (TagB/SpsB family) [Colwellia sp.]|jgi:CDP-glycerol glycerophosphotransferase (TagB/SpsB family)